MGHLKYFLQLTNLNKTNEKKPPKAIDHTLLSNQKQAKLTASIAKSNLTIINHPIF
jgi:hypothetical protein